MSDRDETLAAMIREVAAAHDDVASPAVLAKLVMEKIPIGTERRLLGALLPPYVGEVLRRAETTPTSDLDPDSAWGELMRERVPTDDGYRFLQDCKPEDIEAGAARRRSMAANLSARADVYEAIAASMEQQEVASPAELEPATTLAAIARRGDPIVALAARPHSEIVEALLASRSLIRLATLLHARDNLPDAVRDALAEPDVRNREYSTVQTLVGEYSARPPGEGTHRRADLDALFALRDLIRSESTVRLRGRVAEVGEQLEALSDAAVTARLTEQRATLEAAVLLEARHDASLRLGRILRTPEMLPRAIAALQTIRANLNTAVARARDSDEQLPERLIRDRHRVETLLATLHRLQQEHRRAVGDRHGNGRSDSTPGGPLQRQWSSWEENVLKERKAELFSLWDELQQQHGVIRAPQMPKQGVVAWSAERGLLPAPHPSVQLILDMEDETFRDVVASDAAGSRQDTRLREDWLLDRWRTALIELKDVTSARISDPQEFDEGARRRRIRFLIGLDARLGEQRGLLLQLKDRIHQALKAQEAPHAQLLDELYDQAAETVIRRVRGWNT